MSYEIRMSEQTPNDVVSAFPAQLETRLIGSYTFTLKEVSPYCFILGTVRHATGRPYCGQHAGPCDLPVFGERKVPKTMKFLEWFDWIAFNDIVNDVLDAAGIIADVWSTPQEVRLSKGRKLWIRRGTRRRTQWDYEEQVARAGPLTEYVADYGSDSQFQQPATS